MTVMYDSTTSANIPADAEVIAGYDDGRLYTWTEADWARFPRAHKVHITTTGETLTSDVADIERGDLTPQEAADWIRRRQAAGITSKPTLYCSRSTIAEVEAACEGLDYNLWVAILSPWYGSNELYPGSVATQYSANGLYDISILSDGWPVPNADADPLIGALAYVCDDLGQKLLDIQTEMARVREQFLGAKQ